MSVSLALVSMLFQQDDGNLLGAIFGSIFGLFGLCCGLIFFIIVVAGLWKTFDKAGRPGWAAIIPIYNIYILLQVAGRPGWWLILVFIPVVNFIIGLVVSVDVAKSFGKDALYGIILLYFLAFIGYLMLGFGDAEYLGPAAAESKAM